MSAVRLDVEAILRCTAAAIPATLLDRIVVIGSLASAWAFRDLEGSEAVATKDIDLLLHPSMQACATAVALGGCALRLVWRSCCAEAC